MADSFVDLDVDELWREAMQLPAVEAATFQRAANIATRARQIAAREGVFDLNVQVERHFLPNGRMSFNVSSDENLEFGAQDFKRVRALRRAAKEVRR